MIYFILLESAQHCNDLVANTIWEYLPFFENNLIHWIFLLLLGMQKHGQGQMQIDSLS